MISGILSILSNTQNIETILSDIFDLIENEFSTNLKIDKYLTIEKKMKIWVKINFLKKRKKVQFYKDYFLIH